MAIINMTQFHEFFFLFWNNIMLLGKFCPRKKNILEKHEYR
jgi:hypothetical protein